MIAHSTSPRHNGQSSWYQKKGGTWHSPVLRSDHGALGKSPMWAGTARAGFLSRNPLRASERPGAFAVGGWRSRIEGWVSGSSHFGGETACRVSISIP